MKHAFYDVIILGGGISGLLLGNELSKLHSVLIIEKETNIPSNKFWLTKRNCVMGNAELLSCVDSYYTNLDFVASDLTTYRCSGDYALWNTNLLVSNLHETIKTQNGHVLNAHKFYSYYYSNNKIIVLANSSEYSASLVIDCMGYSSPIIYAKGIVQIIGYYILHGKILKLKKDIAPIGLSNVMIDQKPKYLEIFPLSNGEAYSILIVPERSIRSSTNIQKEFEFIINESSYNQYFLNHQSNVQSLWGIIPVGFLRQRALDRIYFFGEAGQLNPGTTATCLTKILYSYKKVAEFISTNLRNNTLTQSDLDRDLSSMNRFNRKYQLHLFQDILNWNSDDFKQLVIGMNDLGDKLVNDIIFGELDPKDIMRFEIISKLLKNKRFFILKPFLKSVM
ncbi:MAG: hypothetical protein HZB59_06805 [Ignavibacteriales bacterium]|nr:hypothetical protein [Ignavibacteriales bacterium]